MWFWTGTQRKGRAWVPLVGHWKWWCEDLGDQDGRTIESGLKPKTAKLWLPWKR